MNLARLILEDTDILLLDEPTNHLDLRATEWLEDYMLHFKGTVLAISHDRYFLDRVVQRCIEISDGKAEFYSGNYSFYVQERQRRFEEKLKQYEKDQAKIEQLTRAAEQMHLWAFMGNDKLHKRAFSMEKRIEKLQQSEKPKEQKKLSVKFKEREFNGDEVLVIGGAGEELRGKAAVSRSLPHRHRRGADRPHRRQRHRQIHPGQAHHEPGDAGCGLSLPRPRRAQRLSAPDRGVFPGFPLRAGHHAL